LVIANQTFEKII